MTCPLFICSGPLFPSLLIDDSQPFLRMKLAIFFLSHFDSILASMALTYSVCVFNTAFSASGFSMVIC